MRKVWSFADTADGARVSWVDGPCWGVSFALEMLAVLSVRVRAPKLLCHGRRVHSDWMIGYGRRGRL
ncbi:unnamed protein product [Ectocarpus sp. CCAP 1310/34]|nr:unnamed protein product [Ectocarpus sp. CCAP 1310/34]